MYYIFSDKKVQGFLQCLVFYLFWGSSA